MALDVGTQGPDGRCPIPQYVDDGAFEPGRCAPTWRGPRRSASRARGPGADPRLDVRTRRRSRRWPTRPPAPSASGSAARCSSRRCTAPSTWPRASPRSTSSAAAGSRSVSAPAAAPDVRGVRGRSRHLRGPLQRGPALDAALWTEPTVDFDGRFWQLTGRRMEPKPFQKPDPPIWFGGSHPGRAAARRAPRRRVLRRRSSTTAEFVEQVGRARRARGAGRDPAGFRIAKRVYLAVDDDAERARRAGGRGLARLYGDVRAPDLTPVAVTGPPDVCASGLREVADAGAELILLNPLFDEAEQMERLAAEEVPLVAEWAVREASMRHHRLIGFPARREEEAIPALLRRSATPTGASRHQRNPGWSTSSRQCLGFPLPGAVARRREVAAVVGGAGGPHVESHRGARGQRAGRLDRGHDAGRHARSRNGSDLCGQLGAARRARGALVHRSTDQGLRARRRRSRPCRCRGRRGGGRRRRRSRIAGRTVTRSGRDQDERDESGEGGDGADEPSRPAPLRGAAARRAGDHAARHDVGRRDVRVSAPPAGRRAAGRPCRLLPTGAAGVPVTRPADMRTVGGEPVVARRRNSWAKASASAGRSAGSLARAFPITVRTPPGTVAGSGSGARCVCARASVAGSAKRVMRKRPSISSGKRIGT